METQKMNFMALTIMAVISVILMVTCIGIKRENINLKAEIKNEYVKEDSCLEAVAYSIGYTYTSGLMDAGYTLYDITINSDMIIDNGVVYMSNLLVDPDFQQRLNK